MKLLGRWIMLAGVVLGLTGCPMAISPPPPEPDRLTNIQLLTRGYLPKGEPTPEGFGYYSYLIFLDRGTAMKSEKDAAAQAFLDLFSEAETSLSATNPTGIPKEKLAVLFAPIADWKGYSRHVDAFVGSYDYEFACTVYKDAAKRNINIPAVSIVGTGGPIGDQGTLGNGSLEIIDLCDAKNASAKFNELKHKLTTNVDKEAAGSAYFKKIFAELGGALAAAGDICHRPTPSICE